MGLGARGAWAALALGVLLVMALLKVAVDGVDSAGSLSTKSSTFQGSHESESDNLLPEPPNTDESSTPDSPVSSMKTVTTTTTTTTTTTKSGTKTVAPPVSRTTTVHVTTSEATTPSKMPTMQSTTTKSTPKTTSFSKNTPQMSTSTTHDSTETSASSSVTITTTINSKEKKGSKFDTGSFVGGIVLTMGVLSIFYVGCKMYYSRRGIRYSTIDEHEAII